MFIIFLQVSLPIYFSQSQYNIFCICFRSFLVSIIDWRWQEMWHFIWYPTEIGMWRDDTKNGCVADYFCNGSQSIQNRKNQLPFHQTGSAACVLGVFWAGETALLVFVLFPLHRRMGRGCEGGCSPPKFWATQIFWATRENLGKASF